ncbi:hypothetical protein [Chroococcidiopsis sp. CCMEE 29]|uniref:hypothetical protein n=1 Tax=Chroococcidiopsis sp. CCMEE 29 TaxID=155894 RepID=UPI00201FC3A8|nr:hypothetical protein [Chroococcidiopsis sp. CCMEE 29]
MFDYLIVGAGFARSVLAERLASQSGKKILMDQVVAQTLTVYAKLAERGNSLQPENNHALKFSIS